MCALNLDAWWDSPAYKIASGTFPERGAFILAKLKEHDAAKLDTVLADPYRDGKCGVHLILMLRHGAASVRVWEAMSPGRGARRPPPEGVDVAYPLTVRSYQLGLCHLV